MKTQEVDNIDLLSSASFFDVLEPDEKNLIDGIIEQKTFQKGEVIFSESQPAASIFILEEGRVTLTIPCTHTILVREGDIFGEIAIINESARLGTAVARSEVIVSELNTKALYDEKTIPSLIALKLTRVIAKKHSSIKLRSADFSSRELIQQGESGLVEFKSTLRFNLKAEKTDAKIELASLKTVAAFANTYGGILFIGVADDGAVLGLEKDGFPNEDRLLLHFTNLLRDKIGEKALGLVHFEIIHIDGKGILRVDISKSNHPVFVKAQGKEYFYVRSGPSTLSLMLSEFHDYTLKHFQ